MNPALRDSALPDSALHMESPPRCQDDAILSPAGGARGGEPAAEPGLRADDPPQRLARADPQVQHPLSALLQLRPRHRRPRLRIGDAASAEAPELALEEILRVMGELRAAGTLFLSLTGGEVPELAASLPGAGPRARARPGGPDAQRRDAAPPRCGGAPGELSPLLGRQHQRLRRDAGGARRHHADSRLLATDAGRRRAAARPGGRRAPQADRHAPQRARGGGDARALRCAGVPLPARSRRDGAP